MPRKSINSLRTKRLLIYVLIPLVYLLISQFLFAQNSITSISQPDLSKKNVLLFHSFSYEQAAYLTMDPIFVRRFTDAGLDISNVHFEFLGLGKHSDTSYRKEMARLLKRKYGERPIDLIILLHSTGLNFLIRECKGLFPGVPVVHVIATTRFMQLNIHPDLEQQMRSLDQPFIVMPFDVDAKATVETILRIQPNTSKLMIVGGGGPLEKRLEQTIRTEMKTWQGKMDIEYISNVPMEEVLTKVATTPVKTAILFTTFYKDGTGRPYRPVDAGRMIIKASKAPVFGLFETLLDDNGIVGGIMVNQGKEAERAASMAIDILRGKRPTERLTVVLTPLIPMFDWQQLERWGFDAKMLPPGSIVINRPMSLWAQYRIYIIGGFTLFLMQTFLIFSLLIQRSRKRRVEELLSLKNEELDQLFNVSLDMFCVANNKGYFVRLNPAFKKILGYSMEELKAESFIEFVHPEDRDATKEALAALGLQRSLYDFTNRYRCKDGNYRWFEWRATPSGKTIYAAARDVTDRIQSTKELDDRLQFETFLAELSRRFVNIPGEQVDQVINEALREICEFLGFDLANLWQWIPGDSHRFVLTHLYRPLSGPPVIEEMNARDVFPWCLDQLTDGKVIAVSTDTLPVEAFRDQQIWEFYGIKSTLTFPLSTGGKSFFGALGFNTIREKRVWQEDLVKRLQLLAEIFANALDRKNSEEEVRVSEERFSLASSSAGVGLWILDLNTNQFWATEKALELFGFPREYVLNFDIFMNLVHPEDRILIIEAANRASQSNVDIHIEYRIILADKTVRWLSTKGRRQVSYSDTAKRLMGVTMDITDRKLMEVKIIQAAEEWQSTFDAIPYLVMILDMEFKVVRINTAAKSYFGRPIGEIIGTHCYSLMHGREKPFETCPLMKIIASKSHEEAELYDEARKSWLSVTADPVFNESGELLHVIYALKDITEQKKAEAEAFNTRRELLRTVRLMQMAELTASLAHELNQPLTSILSNARAALRFIEADNLDMVELKEILEDISRDDKRAGDIIRNIRAMVRPEEGEQETIRINDLLIETISLFNSEAVIRNIRIETEFEGLLPLVNANRVQMQQVVINLLLNAAESMMDEYEFEDRRIVMQTKAVDGNRVQVTVRDFGAGIDKQELIKIFEPFFTTKRSGLGMGLSLVRSIIEGQGGHIWAENNPDKGATFYFEVPGFLNTKKAC